MRAYLLKDKKTLILETDSERIAIFFKKRRIFAKKIKLEIKKSDEN